jgi:hypothetical protein
MVSDEGRWAGLYAAAWTLILAAGYFGGQFVGLLAPNDPRAQIWRATTLPSLTGLYWGLLTASVAYWVYICLARKRT